MTKVAAHKTNAARTRHSEVGFTVKTGSRQCRNGITQASEDVKAYDSAWESTAVCVPITDCSADVVRLQALQC